jgi:hypothetical protein
VWWRPSKRLNHTAFGQLPRDARSVAGPSRVLPLRRPDECCLCGTALDRGARAWWDAEQRRVECLDCHGADGASPPPTTLGQVATLIPKPVFDRGVAGRSANERYERLHTRREERIEQRWGRLSGLVKAFTDDPQSTTAWARGGEGERRVGARLDDALGETGVVLHDRRIPGSRANIDHLVVAASGVWVVDSKRYSGLVERRTVGGWFRRDLRLYVGRRDRTPLVEGVEWQLEAVERALGDWDVPLEAVLCFIDSEWGWFARPFQFKGVWVTWPKELCRMILRTGSLDSGQVEVVASRLALCFPTR